MTDEWTQRLTGARMQVDQQFQSQVQESQFTNQQWGLIMTAVEFRIDNPETPAEATLVADTENVRHILPELEKIPQGMAGAPQQGGRGNDGGVLGRIRGLFGGSNGKRSDSADEETLTEATKLVDAYATSLQQFLEEQERWEEICDHAASE